MLLADLQSDPELSHGWWARHSSAALASSVRMGVSMFRTFWITYGLTFAAIVVYAAYKLFGS